MSQSAQMTNISQLTALSTHPPERSPSLAQEKKTRFPNEPIFSLKTKHFHWLPSQQNTTKYPNFQPFSPNFQAQTASPNPPTAAPHPAPLCQNQVIHS
jgi:hypothetical protein